MESIAIVVVDRIAVPYFSTVAFIYLKPMITCFKHPNIEIALYRTVHSLLKEKDGRNSVQSYNIYMLRAKHGFAQSRCRRHGCPPPPPPPPPHSHTKYPPGHLFLGTAVPRHSFLGNIVPRTIMPRHICPQGTFMPRHKCPTLGTNVPTLVPRIECLMNLKS